jgi:hypothetical protein
MRHGGRGARPESPGPIFWEAAGVPGAAVSVCAGAVCLTRGRAHHVPLSRDGLTLGKNIALVSGIDDATNVVGGARLFPSDTTLGNMHVL